MRSQSHLTVIPFSQMNLGKYSIHTMQSTTQKDKKSGQNRFKKKLVRENLKRSQTFMLEFHSKIKIHTNTHNTYTLITH